MSQAVDAVLEALTKKHPRKIDLTLNRLRVVLDRMGQPERRLPPIIHIAGTNGKGSTLAFLRAILQAAGYSVHAYTSPHLVRFHERIRLAGKLIDDEHLLDVLSTVSDAAKDDPITFFEATTAAAFQAFADVPADVLLLEVGLGGRFDATNIIPRSTLGVISPISLDHQEFLGNDLSSIAMEKAGIARRDVPLVSHQVDDDTAKVIEQAARDAGAHPILSGTHYQLNVTEEQLLYEDARGPLALPHPQLPGPFQKDNAALAVAALRHQTVWDVPEAAYSAGVRWASWPARLQQLGDGPLKALLPNGAELWLDGGHNPAAGAQVARFIKENFPAETPVHLIMGMLKNKDLPGYLTSFRGLLAGLWGVPVEDHSHHSTASIAAFGQEIGTQGRPGGDVEQVLRRISKDTEGAEPPVVFITGSLYLAGDVLKGNDDLPT